MSQENPSKDDRFRKRHRPSWKEHPAFLDASASVSAATFGARRLPELKQLYEHSLTRKVVVAQDVPFQSGGGQTSSRHLRRRITSHRSRRHRHRFPHQGPGNGDSSTPTTRKAQRSSPSTLAQGHYEWEKSPTDAAPKKVQWIATHLWHAKRFHMEVLWGWQVPVAHTNRGARATLRLSHTHCLLQDITWERQPIFLEFHRDCSKANLVPCLARILPSWGMDSAMVKGLERNVGMTGECMLHHVDQFPRGAIGPVWWRVEDHMVRIMGHPSIRQRVLENTAHLRTNQPSMFRDVHQEKVDGIQSCCVFRLCGTGVMEALQKSIRFQSQEVGVVDSYKISWHSLLEEPGATEKLSHGSTVHATIELSDLDASVSILFVRIQPRPLDCPENRAVAGWELHCNSRHAATIWAHLSMNCAVIGMVDQSHLQLECEPPLPLFPRDFVDCEDSSKYWLPSSRPDGDDSPNLWSHVRQLYEGGWGRLSLPNSPDLKGVQWSKLMAPDGDDMPVEGLEDVNVVTVRGHYGEPFLAIVESCGRKIESPNENVGRLRRNRRRARPANTMNKVQPADKDHVALWRQTVRNLLTSLSLPAVLQAHIVLVDKGVLQCGDHVFVGGSNVGFVTAGSYSPSRGHCHGFGILGASRLLKELCDASFPETLGRITRHRNGHMHLLLAGRVFSSSSSSSNEGQDIAMSFVL